jgi:hypothetical protein
MAAPNALVAECLLRAQEEKVPSPLSLTSGSVLRSPYLWVVVFDTRKVVSASFRTDDDTPGPLSKIFEDAIRIVFSENRVGSPPCLPASQLEDAASLQQLFESVGLSYATHNWTPAPPINTAGEAASNFLRIVSPLIRQAQTLLTEMNQRFISYKGGQGGKYAAANELLPSSFAASEREAVRKATQKSEEWTAGGARGGAGPKEKRQREPRMRDGKKVCDVCDKTYVGKWKTHRKSADCTK